MVIKIFIFRVSFFESIIFYKFNMIQQTLCGFAVKHVCGVCETLYNIGAEGFFNFH